MHIYWDKQFEIGNTLIDTEHRMLIMLFRKLDIAIKTRQPHKTILRIIVEAKKFAEFHFISEENLMYELNYPELAKHEVMHSQLLAQLEILISRISHKREFPDDLLFFMNKWLVTHIGKEDSKIALYAMNSEQRPIGEEMYSQFLAAIHQTD
ncbi:MAG: hemerythrin family protein [Burkholderiales bacterium]|nr:hemerythrin family protein [Burkholderiales bacterium]